MAKWQQKYRVDWDATDGRNGGASADSVGNFDGKGKVSLEKQRKKIKERWHRFSTWRRPSSVSASRWSWAWATHFSCPKEDLAGAVRLFRVPEEGGV